jgi:hypothetical protein
MTSLNEIANAGIKDLAKDSLDWLDELCPDLEGLTTANILEKGTKLAKSDQEGVIKLDNIHSVVMAYDFREFLKGIIGTEEDLLDGGLDKINSGPSIGSVIGIVSGATVLTSFSSAVYSSQIMPFLKILNASLPQELLPSTELDAWCAAKLSLLASNERLGRVDHVFDSLGYNSESGLFNGQGFPNLGERRVVVASGEGTAPAFYTYFNPEIPASSMIFNIYHIRRATSDFSDGLRELDAKFRALPNYEKAVADLSESFEMSVVEMESLALYDRMLAFITKGIEEHVSVDVSELREHCFTTGAFALLHDFFNNGYSFIQRSLYSVNGLPFVSGNMNAWSGTEGITRCSSMQDMYNALTQANGCEIDLFEQGFETGSFDAGYEKVSDAMNNVNPVYAKMFMLISSVGMFLQMFDSHPTTKRLNRASIGVSYVAPKDEKLENEVMTSSEFATQLNNYIVYSSK